MRRYLLILLAGIVALSGVRPASAAKPDPKTANAVRRALEIVVVGEYQPAEHGNTGAGIAEHGERFEVTDERIIAVPLVAIGAAAYYITAGGKIGGEDKRSIEFSVPKK